MSGYTSWSGSPCAARIASGARRCFGCSSINCCISSTWGLAAHASTCLPTLWTLPCSSTVKREEYVSNWCIITYIAIRWQRRKHKPSPDNTKLPLERGSLCHESRPRLFLVNHLTLDRLIFVGFFITRRFISLVVLSSLLVHFGTDWHDGVLQGFSCCF